MTAVNIDATNADLYLRFVSERHRAWERRRNGEPAPWSDDPIIQEHKFTNVFRVLDYGSQFLLKQLLYGPDAGVSYADLLMRCFLYRYTNRPEPWEWFYRCHGRYPGTGDLGEHGLLSVTWQRYKRMSNPVFGNAYKMFCGKENAGTDRLTWVLAMVDTYFSEDSPESIVTPFAEALSQQDRFAVLSSVPRCADFMSMQILTDAGYAGLTPGCTENDFIVPGPGARRGAKHIAPGENPLDVIAWAQGAVDPSVVIPLPDGGVRSPSLMDLQNTLCEFGKYMRYYESGSSRGVYKPAHPGPQTKIALPEHWVEPRKEPK